MYFFAVGRLIKAVIEKQESQIEKTKQIQMPNPKGGAIQLQIGDNSDLGELILSCIADNEFYSSKSKDKK